MKLHLYGHVFSLKMKWYRLFKLTNNRWADSRWLVLLREMRSGQVDTGDQRVGPWDHDQ